MITNNIKVLNNTDNNYKKSKVKKGAVQDNIALGYLIHQ